VTALVALVAAFPLLGGLALLGGVRARSAGYATMAGGAGALAAAIAMAIRVETTGPFQAFSGFVYVDSLSVLMAITVALVVTLAGLGSAAYLRTEETAGELSHFQVRLYVVAFALFASMMLASFETGNLGLLWVLIEASTLASAVLVALEAKPVSLEAAWKYIIISSLGVTMALVAIVFLFYATSALHLSSNQRLTWAVLFAHGHALQPDSLRLAFLLAVVGFGTKVGLAPMHTWLPDAHAEAPSPASAMLSAALLNTGMYAIIRFQAIAGVRLGRYPGRVLLVFGFLSLVIGTLFMVRQGNFKRLFAYSSIEHMGIIAIALGFGGVLGLYGALLHTLNHAIGKAVLFLTGGELVARFRTRVSAEVQGALGGVPLIGAVLLLGSLAVAGSPPFGLFLSEFTIVRAGFNGSNIALTAVLVAFLALAFLALMRSTTSMALGPGPPREAGSASVSPARVLGGLPLVWGMTMLLLLGVWIPGGLNELIMHAVRVIG
jgi:hydrogenase-4 component F